MSAPKNIEILLHSDRSRPGTLIVRGGLRGRQGLFSCACLGRSAGDPRRNPSADPLRWRGHTPTGSFALTSFTTLSAAIRGIGRYWIALDPVAGQALAAEQAGRKGLGIHGGRGDVLMPTHGCIRLRDRDMLALRDVLGKARFTVSVREVA